MEKNYGEDLGIPLQNPIPWGSMGSSSSSFQGSQGWLGYKGDEILEEYPGSKSARHAPAPWLGVDPGDDPWELCAHGTSRIVEARSACSGQRLGSIEQMPRTPRDSWNVHGFQDEGSVENSTWLGTTEQSCALLWRISNSKSKGIHQLSAQFEHIDWKLWAVMALCLTFGQTPELRAAYCWKRVQEAPLNNAGRRWHVP